MHMDPIIPFITTVSLAVVLIGLLLHRIRQPLIVAYLLVGIVLGPHGLSYITDEVLINRMGSIGVLLLLFFVGMEISLTNLISNWRIAVVGTLLQIFISVFCIGIFGYFLSWPFSRILLLGFVISLSSTAVVIKILQEWNEIQSEVGRDVIGILLVQDLAIIPMLIIINLIGGKAVSQHEIILQVVGGILILGLLFWIAKRGEIKIPIVKYLRIDHEMQVFVALLICMGLALISDIFKLSAALGAFVAGIVVSSARETVWVHKSLESFHVVFIAFFFISIGLLLDLDFLFSNYYVIFFLVFFALITNTFINAFIMKMLGINWNRSLYAGSILAPIGEFSFVLAAVGFQSNLISNYSYQTTIAVISLCLLISPFWIRYFKLKTKMVNNTI